jgi:GH24 family phage-related lysozyme (muramidase)
MTNAQKYNEMMNNSKGTHNPKDLNTSQQLKKHLKEIEGYDERPYNDLSDGDLRHDTTGQGQGTCTIGWGTALHSGPCNGPADTALKKQPISSRTAELWFNNDIHAVEQIIQDKVKAKLTQSQYDSLVSFVYNVGDLSNHRADLINDGKYYEAALTIENGPDTAQGGGYLPVLDERRFQEATMFLFGP